ncbi:MAG: hypothetical protein R2864_03990 [Syntrophotaleaceae bacterium]
MLDFFAPFRAASPENLSGKDLQLLARHLGLTLEADLARDPEAVEPANLKSLLLAEAPGKENDKSGAEKAELVQETRTVSAVQSAPGPSEAPPCCHCRSTSRQRLSGG